MLNGFYVTKVCFNTTKIQPILLGNYDNKERLGGRMAVNILDVLFALMYLTIARNKNIIQKPFIP